MAAVRWPSEYDPANTKVFVSNQITIAAEPEVIWAWLVRAQQWPDWYSNASNVRLPVSSPDLSPGMVFEWSTFGVGLVSTVKEFEPYSRLAWDARATGIAAYHAWVIERTGPKQCLVLTEETQKGWVARLGKLVMPARMSRYHQIWLEGLKAKAESGIPGKKKG